MDTLSIVSLLNPIYTEIILDYIFITLQYRTTTIYVDSELFSNVFN